MASIPVFLALTGSAYLAATLALAWTPAPLGSARFFAIAGVCWLAFVVMLVRVWRAPARPRWLLLVAFALALAFRAPLAFQPVGPDSDLMRYLWDGRVQLLGYNPYQVRPADPGMAHTHTDDTRDMPSARARTPYPPAAQVFFRTVVRFADSAQAMKLALVAFDVLTMLVVWRWIVVTRGNEWRALAYAWNPLVVLEVAHSGHIDSLGAFWIATTAWLLARRRTALAAASFVMAVATKLLPIVLLPLFWKRLYRRDVLLGAALLLALYLPFATSAMAPLGDVPNVVAFIRFNGPLFLGIWWLAGPNAAAAFAVLLGLTAAAWARWRLPASDPAAWAWPMGLSLLAAPVIYPWYLLYFTPFLLTRTAVPLLVWTASVIPTYIVWQLAPQGAPWRVPIPVMILEFGAFLVAAVVVYRRSSQLAAGGRQLAVGSRQ